MNVEKTPIKPRLAVIDGVVTVTSLAIAEHFQKDHGDLLSAILSLECSKAFHESHFLPSEYEDAQGRSQPMFRMTRDGFAMLAIGFTNRRDKTIKNTYLNAFQQLETATGKHSRFGEGLASPALPAKLAPAAPTVFQFDGLSVRTLERDGQIWFVAADVCAALELGNASLAVNGNPSRQEQGGLDDDEKGLCSVNTPSGEQQMLVVNESGLYALIFKSRKLEAKKFKKWVTSEVLPTIRKTGRYGAPFSHQQADKDSFFNEMAFLRLYYAFDQNMGPAALLWVLMQMGAASEWISPTVREIAAASGGRISKSNVTRCAVNLKQRGLIDMKADLPWTTSAYFVFDQAVMTLLREVGKQLAGLPGIQDDDALPWLQGNGVKTLH